MGRLPCEQLIQGRTKKLIAAALMTADIGQKIYTCDYYLQHGSCRRDCKEEINWNTVCYECFGKNPTCYLCTGSGRVKRELCPRLLARGESRLLPYFFDWYYRDNPVWPDGTGLYYQPLKLRGAFNFLASWYHNTRKKDGDQT